MTVASGEIEMISLVSAYSITAENTSPFTFVVQSLMISYHSRQKEK
ncbi:MAG: hypothetical protein K2K08_09865 [Paramuribaculum sp.]|nr:hypothetical protein [Paramuribaculum sp.]